MILLSYPQKFGHICEDNGFPKEWAPETFGQPVFIHGEDEDDIKNLLEKLKFKDEEREAFEEFYNSDDLEASGEDKEEILFEVLFRKANRAYSFMQKVVDSYQDMIKKAFTNKVRFVKMLYNMFEECHERIRGFLYIYMHELYQVIKPTDVLEFLDSIEEVKEGHLQLLVHINSITKEKGQDDDLIKGYEIMKKYIEKLKGNKYIDIMAVSIFGLSCVWCLLILFTNYSRKLLHA